MSITRQGEKGTSGSADSSPCGYVSRRGDRWAMRSLPCRRQRPGRRWGPGGWIGRDRAFAYLKVYHNLIVRRHSLASDAEDELADQVDQWIEEGQPPEEDEGEKDQEPVLV